MNFRHSEDLHSVFGFCSTRLFSTGYAKSGLDWLVGV